jgi:hypothetical protein
MRISKRVVMVGLAALAVAATLVVVVATTGQPGGPGPAEGWRWESYGGVSVQVPAHWGYGTTGTPPCGNRGDGEPRPYVGRPGVVALVACPGLSVPALADRADYLWFDSRAEPGVREHGSGWVEETRVVAGVSLTVLSDDAALRARIFDSASPATGSPGPGGGCPADHPVTTARDARPDPGPGGLGTVGPAASITLCRYAIGRLPQSLGSPVLSASELTGTEATAVVRAILAAPEGGGPNEPDNCLPEVAHGGEMLVLTVRGGSRTQEVFVRYSGCDGHGIDDGRTLRRLTADALKPLLSGPHLPTALNGAVAELVWK